MEWATLCLVQMIHQLIQNSFLNSACDGTYTTKSICLDLNSRSYNLLSSLQGSVAITKGHVLFHSMFKDQKTSLLLTLRAVMTVLTERIPQQEKNLWVGFAKNIMKLQCKKNLWKLTSLMEEIRKQMHA